MSALATPLTRPFYSAAFHIVMRTLSSRKFTIRDTCPWFILGKSMNSSRSTCKIFVLGPFYAQVVQKAQNRSGNMMSACFYSPSAVGSVGNQAYQLYIYFKEWQWIQPGFRHWTVTYCQAGYVDCIFFSTSPFLPIFVFSSFVHLGWTNKRCFSMTWCLKMERIAFLLFNLNVLHFCLVLKTT